MINREFPFNQPIHPEDNRSINKAFDRNYGNRLKSGDTTPLKYTIKDGDGEPLDKDRLMGMETTVKMKHEGVTAYEAEFEATLEEVTENYEGDLVARYKITEALPPSDTPYIVEFHFEEADDRFIFPSGNNLELHITPSSLNSDGEAIKNASEQRLNEIVERKLDENPVLSEAEANELARQENYQELLDTGVMQENINQKLAESEAEYAPRLTELEQNDADLAAQLAQKANQSFVDTQLSAIVSGAPKGTYADLDALRSAYPNGADGIFLTLDNGHWYYWDVASLLWTDGGVYMATGSDDFPATNIISYGNFANDTDGNGIADNWEILNSSIATYSYDDVEKAQVFDSTYSNIFLYSDELPLIPSHKYFVSFKYKRFGGTTGKLRVGFGENAFVPQNIKEYYIDTDGFSDSDYITLNRIVDYTSDTDKKCITFSGGDGLNCYAKLKDVLIIDLTETFGIGKEPSVEVVEHSLEKYQSEWFEGTVSPFVSNKELFNNAKEKEATKLLLNEKIAGTKTTVAFTNGKPTRVTHKRVSDDVTVRTDVYTWGSGSVTEVRTLFNGKSVTITTNLITLERVVN